MDLPSTTRITVKPTGASLGADIIGVDLTQRRSSRSRTPGTSTSS